MEKWAKPRKRSWKKDQSILDRDVIPNWGRRKAKSITRRDVVLLLDEIMDRNKLKWDFLEPVEFRGAPTQEHLDLIRQRGVELAKAVKAWVAG